MNEQIARQLARKEVIHFSNKVRNMLQLEARELESASWRLLGGKNAHVSDVSELIGKIEGYVDIRRVLCPYVAQDGYSGKLTGLKNKLIDLRATFYCQLK